MGNYNWRKHYAVKANFDKEFSWIPETSGIYLWTRKDLKINIVKEFLENKEFDTLLLNACMKDFQIADWNDEITTWYIGQAKNLRNRRFDYYKIQTGIDYPKRHFENSLKAHKDWQYQILQQCPQNELDIREFLWIWTYMAKPNHITRNEALVQKDAVKANTKRINKIRQEYQKALSKLLKHMRVLFDDKQIVIHVKLNKDNSINKQSQNAYNQLKEWIKEILNEKNEEKNQNV